MDLPRTPDLDRDPTRWLEVADHPEVFPHVYTIPFDLREVVAHPDVLPFWCGGGGFLLHRMGSGYDLHALFTPEHWGRHVATSLRRALALVFSRGAAVVTVSEVEGWWRSRPPLSFGFRPFGGFREQYGHSLRQWVLTAEAWFNSPAYRRASCLPL